MCIYTPGIVNTKNGDNEHNYKISHRLYDCYDIVESAWCVFLIIEQYLGVSIVILY
jgi:hypothetical protein